MTKQEKALWAAVMVLSAGLLFMGSWMVFSGALSREGLSREEGSGSSAVAMVQEQAITEEAWSRELKRRYGSEVLLTMMNRQVAALEAEQANITVAPEEIEQELDRMAQSYGSRERFLEAMAQLGLSEEVLKEETEYRLLLEKIATADVKVSSSEIDQYLEDHPDQFVPKKQLDLSLIKVEEESLANELLDRLEDGEDFAALAAEHSIDEYTREDGGRLGLIEEDDPFQPQELMETVLELSSGDIAGPIALEDGFGIVYVKRILVPAAPDPKLTRETVRRQLALERSESLSQLEQRLRSKYEARMLAGASPAPFRQP
ncbi:peptidylprolyl isomerase [Paenibacillus sp. F411]|uniref:peptidylprolyl isomerase n=1 Tax=Paenibacillus sp. F411 TaxID=2820239 RepID=UPI001AAF28AA|nr:peptidylprolyl isomerase [Paenibacillus sp. F411]MBO2945968.1 peptidylprolyl isomerase [Paenibacillus sp. F411]